jgi:hypothetical protein
LASKAKATLFSFFGENDLPAIKSTATPIEISRWKKLKEVKTCYKRLFQPFDFGDDLILEKIIEKVFSEKEDPVPKVQIAYVIAICVTILNPKYDKIKLERAELEDKMACFLVGFCKFVNYDLNRQIMKIVHFYLLKYTFLYRKNLNLMKL